MKNLRKCIVISMACVLAVGMMLMAAGCGGSGEEEQTAADPVAECNAAIEAIQVQEFQRETQALL